MSQKSRTSGGLADISNLNEQQLVEKTEEIWYISQKIWERGWLKRKQTWLAILDRWGRQI